ncbi:hypothetical protein TNCV_319101 [Trichonephila clavipes]|nr:hypothetical protein TNCV_319101 [Trichonephila clavipes]
MCTRQIAGYLIETDIIFYAFQKHLDIFRPRKKSSSKTLNPDPTPTSGLGKLRCPWAKPVGCHCDTALPGGSISSTTRSRFVGGQPIKCQFTSHHRQIARNLPSYFRINFFQLRLSINRTSLLRLNESQAVSPHQGL